MRKRSLLALVTMLLLLASAAPAQKKKGEADKLYKEGVELLKQGDVDGAVDLFKKAVAIKRTAPLLFNLGQATAKLGQIVEARAILSEAKAEAEKNGPEAMVDLSKNALAALEARFPRLIVELPKDVKDADVQIDGKKADRSPDGTMLDPGKHEVAVTASGYERYTETVELKEGDKKRITPKLEADLGSPTVARRREKKAEEPSGKPFPIGPVVLGGVGLAAIGGATYMFFKVKSIDKERHDLWEESGCPGPSCPSGEPDDAQTLRESSESKAKVGNILLIAGSACVLGAGVWFYFSSKSGSNKEQAGIGVMPVPGGAVITGRL